MKGGNLMNYFKNLKIKYKLMLLYSTIFIFSFSIFNIITYSNYKAELETSIGTHLELSTSSMVDMVKTAADTSIKNHLRTLADNYKHIAENYHKRYLSGEMTLEEAKTEVSKLLLEPTIGSTGYLYIVDSEGILEVHPVDELVETSIETFDFGKKQIELKTGYIEYDWKNPEDTKTRPKALYMTYFEPWDWIISASSYREEFTDLINIHDFEESFLSKKFGKTGYSYVIGNDGKFIIHPFLQDVNILDAKDDPRYDSIFYIFNKKTGVYTYPWKNPNEDEFREKLAVFEFIPEYNWIVTSSGYSEEFYSPLFDVQKLLILTTLASFVLIVLINERASRIISKPLEQFSNQMQNGSKGNLDAYFHYKYDDEIGTLSRYYNHFLDDIKGQQDQLKLQIVENNESKELIRANEKRLKTILETMNEGFLEINLNGEIKDVNPELAIILGYSQEELLSMNMYELLDSKSKDLLSSKITDRKMGLEDSYEMEFLTKSNEKLYTLINATPLIDDFGDIYGSFGIITDISELKQLTMNLEQKVSERTLELQKTIDLLNETKETAIKAELLGSLNHLVAGVAHNINTPLGVSISSVSHIRFIYEELVQKLSENKLSKKNLISFVKKIDESTTLLENNLKRVDKLIKSFKLLSGSQSIGERKVFSLNAHLKEIARHHFEHPMLEHPVPISLALADITIDSYPNAFNIIFEQLYDNTIEFGSDGIFVSIRLYKNDNNIFVEYRESYASDRLNDEMFKPFYTSMPDSHSGLGLTIVQNIVNKTLNGSVFFDIAEDNSSNLVMKLPIALLQHRKEI
jgi:PAS domain S-box-containing protein